jgi:PIN domain nuclease of toxin-antitoxin system
VTQLLLDTNVVIWLLTNDRRSVTRRAREALEDRTNQVTVSAVSVWEMAVKRSLGKLVLGRHWADELARLDFASMAITAEHAAHVEQLPWHHRDPFDRLLIAQAMLEEHYVVTADPRFAAYGVDVLW